MIRLLIVDDDPFIRESLKVILQMDEGILVEGTCTNGSEAAQWAAVHHPEVVLMDIRMPICDGVEGTRLIKAASPSTAVLILTTFDDEEYLVQAIRNGANGYLLKNIAPDRIIQGIKAVAQGDMLIHPEIGRKLANILQQPPLREEKRSIEHCGLTQTEQNIVMKIADGLSNKEIAQELFLSEGTVKNYISEILSKLSLRDRTQIAIFYWKQIKA